jgi:diguanylate cyclase (GGDEF)-like protein/PAS domain S-box-containing protein
MHMSFELSIIDSLAEHIAVLDERGQITFVNESWRRFARENAGDARATEAIGVNYLDVCAGTAGRADGDEGEQAANGIRSVLAGESHRFEMDYPCHAPHEKRWFRLSVSRVNGPEGVAVVSHLNVTQRVLAELAEDHAHAMQQELFDIAPVGIAVTDLESLKTTDVNRALCALVGYTREELLASDMAVCTPGSHREIRERNLAIARTTGRYGPIEACYVHKDGRIIDVLLNGTVVDVAGPPLLYSIEQDITQRKLLERGLRAAAEQDRLTGLPNRAALLHRLEKLIERSAVDPSFRFALFFLDLDRFKFVNDTLGHDAGDELLITIGKRLRGALRDLRVIARNAECFTARFGGDEFVFVAQGIDNIGEVGDIGRRLQSILSVPYEIKGQRFQSTASIGVAISDSSTAGTADLMRNADMAMYEAKRAGRGNTLIFDQAMRQRKLRTLDIEAGLRDALARGEFTLLYEPIVDLETGATMSAEVRLQWDHPKLGCLAPVEFVPIAEESGLIVPIAEWMLGECCLQWSRWQHQRGRAAPRSVSVNLSRVHMTGGNGLPGKVVAALAAAGMPANALQIEIAESDVIKSPDGARDLLRVLAATGVQLALDDFGTGAFPLASLRDYPFNAVKIDKSFVAGLVSDPHVLAVAHATINVIENLGMASIAKGVRETAEVAMLQAMGCRAGQGSLFGLPVTAEALLRIAAPGAND